LTSLSCLYLYSASLTKLQAFVGERRKEIRATIEEEKKAAATAAAAPPPAATPTDPPPSTTTTDAAPVLIGGAPAVVSTPPTVTPTPAKTAPTAAAPAKAEPHAAAISSFLAIVGITRKQADGQFNMDSFVELCGNDVRHYCDHLSIIISSLSMSSNTCYGYDCRLIRHKIWLISI
jgi:hypothetical protein